MYRHTSSALGFAALTGTGLHASGINPVWTPVAAATGVGVALALGRIAIGLGAPHPSNLLAGLRRHLSNSNNTDA